MVLVIIQNSRLKEDEGAVPSAVAEAHRKQLEEIDEVVRKEQQVSPNEVKEGVRPPPMTGSTGECRIIQQCSLRCPQHHCRHLTEWLRQLFSYPGRSPTNDTHDAV